MDRIEFRRSRAKNAVLLLIGVLLVAASLFMAVSGEDQLDRVIGWFGTAFFGLAIVVALRNIVRGGVVFTFDSGGIADHANGIVIPWSEIEECVVISIRGTRFLGITFRNPEQFSSRVSAVQHKLARLNERMGWGHWGLSFSGISPGIDEALHFIRRNAPAVRAPAA